MGIIANEIKNIESIKIPFKTSITINNSHILNNDNEWDFI